jgi:hypothetical protein
VFLTITGADGALASAPVWRLQPSPNATVPGGQFESVSCSSATACTAVGSNISTAGIHITLAERWNGTTWQHQHTPNPAVDVSFNVAPDLAGVSCPVATFCEAVGRYNATSFNQVSIVEGWNGNRWALQRFPLPAGASSTALSQVSCTSARFCEAVGSYQTQTLNQTLPLAATWNGTSWHLQHAPHLAGDPSVQLNVVSCALPTFCEAWGGASPSLGGPDLAEQWNGHSWRLQAVPSTSDEAFSVSCVSATFCEAVGVGGASQAPSAWVWRGSSWTAQTLPSQLGLGSLHGVSCVSPAFCEAVGLDFNAAGAPAAVWNGSAWQIQSTPNPAKNAATTLSAVACASMRSCESAGDFELNQSNTPHALTEDWNGRTWGLQRAAAPAGATTNVLSAVSCVSASFCEAVGEHGNNVGTQSNLAEVWNGTTWQIQRTPNPGSPFGPPTNVLEDVSCVSTSFCEAVGNGPDGMAALGWNGTSWQVQNRPGNGGFQSRVSCPSVTFCMSIDANGQVDTWNGTSWGAGTNLTGFSPVDGLSCVSASFCEVVGGGPAGESAAVWNGSTWTDQATPGGTGEALIAVTCLTASSCEAVGELVNQGNPVTLAEVWNGSAWTIQPTPNPSLSMGSVLNGLSCTSVSACTAVGQDQTGSFGPFRTLAEVWDGTTWSLRSTPNHVNAGQNILNGVSCGASRMCSAVGQTQNAIGIQATLIESGD